MIYYHIFDSLAPLIGFVSDNLTYVVPKLFEYSLVSIAFDVPTHLLLAILLQQLCFCSSQFPDGLSEGMFAKEFTDIVKLPCHGSGIFRSIEKRLSEWLSFSTKCGRACSMADMCSHIFS